MFEGFDSTNLHGGALAWHGAGEGNLEWTFYYSKVVVDVSVILLCRHRKKSMTLTPITVSAIDCISTGIGNWDSTWHDGHVESHGTAQSRTSLQRFVDGHGTYWFQLCILKWDEFAPLPPCRMSIQ